MGIDLLSLFFNLRHLERRRQGLLELVSLVVVLDAEGVQIPGAPDLELGGAVGRLHNLDGAGVLAARREQELLDLFDSLRLRRRGGAEGERRGVGRDGGRASAGYGRAIRPDKTRHITS